MLAFRVDMFQQLSRRILFSQIDGKYQPAAQARVSTAVVIEKPLLARRAGVVCHSLLVPTNAWLYDRYLAVNLCQWGVRREANFGDCLVLDGVRIIRFHFNGGVQFR